MLSLLLGENIVVILNLLPFSLLGVLLVFAGLELALMISDLQERKDLFVSLFMLGLALVFNLAVAFISGVLLAYLLKAKKIDI